MIEYDEHIDDELTQMHEGASSINEKADAAIHLDDPISSIDLKIPFSVSGESSIADCLKIMKEKRIGCLLVTKDGILEGIFTERDIIRRIVGKSLAHSEIKVKDYMTEDPDTLKGDAPLAFALNYMVLGGYRHVPIVDDENCPVACLSIKDVVKHIGDYYFSEISNLPPTPKNPGWAAVDGG